MTYFMGQNRLWKKWVSVGMLQPAEQSISRVTSECDVVIPVLHCLKLSSLSSIADG